jgi:hypothetical protein
MANPTSFSFDPLEQTFTFSNNHTTIVADTTIVPPPTLPLVPPESVTVEQVTITTPHDHAVILPITDVVVPPPVVDHVFDLFIP